MTQAEKVMGLHLPLLNMHDILTFVLLVKENISHNSNFIFYLSNAL